MDDIYYSIIKEVSSRIKIKGSKFIGYVKPVDTIGQAEKYISFISEQNYDATHNCTAFKVGVGDNAIYRYNDDGEPGGTGGRPILEAIEAQGLTNIVSVVTRYFGGTKLGTGGLSRAYRSCTDQALIKAGKRKLFFTETFLINFSYDLTGIIMEFIDKFACTIEDKKYDTETEFKVTIQKSQSDEFKQKLINKTGGKITIKETENEFN
ncbi:MAG: YigZ family protein [bacterium]